MSDLSLFGLLTDLIPIFSTLTPLLLGAALWWLKGQFPSKADFEALRGELGDLASQQTGANHRLDAIERDIDDPPTRVDLLREMGDLKAKVGAMEAANTGLQQQLKVTNQHLQILVQKGLK